MALSKKSEKAETEYQQAQKMEAVGRLTAGIAHDFNNLLTVINGFASVMQLTMDPNDPQQERVSSILKAGHRGANLIRQLLAFSRKEVIKPEVLDLNDTLSDMEGMLRHLIGESVAMEICLPPDLWPVKIGAAQIEQVIINLAVNARDAMPEGGTLSLRTANLVIDGTTANRYLDFKMGEYVVLTVRDSGHGMSEEIQTHIFEPFFSTKSTGCSTGLGLAIVYGIVKRSGGSIVVDSKEGAGTAFHIYFPRESGVVEAPLHTIIRSTNEDLSGSETILLVERDAAVRDLVRSVLVAQGYRLLEAEEARKAVRIASQCTRPVDLLLIDIATSAANSRNLARNISEKLGVNRVLLISGYDDRFIPRHSADASPPVLQKPFSPLELARKVRAVLDQ